MDSADLIDHLPTLRRLARRLVVDEDAAEDVLNEAVTKARTAVGRDVRDLPKYAAGVLRFVAKRRNRADERRRHHEAAAGRERPRIIPAADTIAERVELMGAALEEIRRLPAAQSRAVGLRYLDDVPVKDIAELEGCTPSTVRTHLARGLATVRERLDARFGGRATWSSVLAPWALDLAPVAESVGHGSRTKASAKAGVGSSTGALGGALLTMTTLKALALLTPVALAATWFASTQLGTSVGPSALAMQSTPPVTEESLAEPTSTAPVADDASRTAGTAAPAVATGRAATSVNVETFPLRARVVGAASGMPQPGVRVEFIPLKGSARPKAGAPLQAVTDEEGRVEVKGEALAAQTLFVAFYDAKSGFPLGSQSNAVFPFDGELVLDGSEALYLNFVGAPTVDASEPCQVSLYRGSFETATSHPAEPHWVRFDAPLSADVQSLFVRSYDGFHFGTASLTDAQGTAQDPVPVRFVAGGSAAFRSMAPKTEVSNSLEIRRRGSEDDGPLSVTLRPSEDGSEWVAEAKHLMPGDYTWEYGVGSAQREGTFRVSALETTEVRVKAPNWSGAQTTVLIDASAVPDADLRRWHFQALEESDIKRFLKAKIERSEPAESGLWLVTIDELPPGEWQLVIGDVKGYQVSQQLVRLEAGETAGPVIVTPSAGSANVSVRVIDDTTEELIPHVKLWTLTGMDGRPSESSRSGVFDNIALSGDTASSLFAVADGYGLAQLDYEPGQSEHELTIRLRKGWRSRVLIFDMKAQGFADGVDVHVDGERIGATDATGSLWFEREGAPTKIEVARDQDGFEVLMDPFEAGSAGNMDTPGYVFVVRSK